MMENCYLFQPMKIKGKIKKLIINIALICKNDYYYEPKNFTQVDNYCEQEEVAISFN